MCIRTISAAVLSAILILSASAADTQEPHPKASAAFAELASIDAFRADIAGDWWSALTDAQGHPRGIPGPLLIPKGSRAVPVPNDQGQFSYAEFSRFLGSELNMQKNAVRLLGTPDRIEKTPDGIVTLSWTSERLSDFPTQDGLQPARPTLRITPPGSYEWTYAPRQAPKAEKSQRPGRDL